MPRYEIRDWVDVYYMQRCIRDLATAIGFPRSACAELAIVVSELVSNILKYAQQGTIDLETVRDVAGTGIAVTAADAGAPFQDLSAALTDGWTDRGPIDPADFLKRKGIGGGLGAVVRLTDSFQVLTDQTGKKVRVVRYLRPPPR